jgi:hypothetical protein
LAFAGCFTQTSIEQANQPSTKRRKHGYQNFRQPAGQRPGEIRRVFHERQKKLGVVFRGAPKKMGPVTIATFEDICGNLIQIAQQ